MGSSCWLWDELDKQVWSTTHLIGLLQTSWCQLDRFTNQLNSTDVNMHSYIITIYWLHRLLHIHKLFILLIKLKTCHDCDLSNNFINIFIVQCFYSVVVLAKSFHHHHHVKLLTVLNKHRSKFKHNWCAVCVSVAGLLLILAALVGGVFTSGGRSRILIDDR